MGHIRLTHGNLVLRNDQQQTCKNVTCRNQTLTTKNYLVEGHQKKIQYPKQYKNATGKGLSSGKDNEVL